MSRDDELNVTRHEYNLVEPDETGSYTEATTPTEDTNPFVVMGTGPCAREEAPMDTICGQPAAVHSLRAPMLRVDLMTAIGELRQAATWRTRGHHARTLAKYPELRVVLVTMREGSRLHEHRTTASITVHVLTGRLRLRVDGTVVELRFGDLLSIDGGLAHDVEAVEESAFLLTLSSPRQQGKCKDPRQWNDAAVDEADEESFPASDPPAWTPAHPGEPVRIRGTRRSDR